MSFNSSQPTRCPMPGTLQSVGPQMGQPLLHQAPPMQMPYKQTMPEPDLDLVTVTPQGLAVTPLNGHMPPPGVPMLQEFPQALSHDQAQDFDLVTVTPQGLAVTPLNGNPPPAGVPFLDPNVGSFGQPQTGYFPGTQPMY